MGNLLTLEECRKRGCGVILYLTSWAALKACVFISLAGKNFNNIRLPKWLTQPANAGDAEDLGLIPGWGRSRGGGNGNPLQYSCLENPMVRGAWWVTVHGITRVGHDLVTKPPPCSLYACLLERFYYKWVLNFVKGFPCIIELIIWFLIFNLLI